METRNIYDSDMYSLYLIQQSSTVIRLLAAWQRNLCWICGKVSYHCPVHSVQIGSEAPLPMCAEGMKLTTRHHLGPIENGLPIGLHGLALN
jgi:hypothetical protein